MHSDSNPLHALLPLLLTDRSPAWLLCDQQGRVLDWDGPLETHGIAQLKKGLKADEQVDFLAGLLPLDSAHLYLPCVETSADHFSEVYALRDTSGDRVFLLDTTQEQKTQQALLQKANELALLREHLNRHLTTGLL